MTGRVLDANTFDGLNGASLLDDLGGEHLTVATPEDPSLGGGYYVMFAPTGTHVFTATLGGGYLPDIRTVEVASGQTANQDFLLPAGNLVFNHPDLSARLQFGETSLQVLNLTNLGGAPADVELVELKGGFLPLGPFEEPDFGVKIIQSRTADEQRPWHPRRTLEQTALSRNGDPILGSLRHRRRLGGRV